MMAYQKNFDAARRPNVDRRFCSAAGAALHFSAARPYVGVSGRFRPWLGSMRRPSGAVSRSVTLAGTASAADRQLPHSLERKPKPEPEPEPERSRSRNSRASRSHGVGHGEGLV